MTCSRRILPLAVVLALCSAQAAAGPIRHPDHYEFDATLNAAFAPETAARAIEMRFDYPGAGAATLAAWRIEVLDASGAQLRSWIGLSPLEQGRGMAALHWDQLDRRGRPVAAGFYTLRLRAVPAVQLGSESPLPLNERVSRSFRLAAAEVVEQSQDIQVGQLPRPAMPAFAGLPGSGERAKAVAATAGLPFTVYYGNLHSQTNHSDGGADVASCGGSEVPQGGSQGPSEAFAMMDVQAAGDFLLASEHNHMYDGSTGTNTSASPATANALFAAGVAAASDYSAAHPDFLALYGNEWGVISNGGHLNIFNPDALPSWEYNSSNQLIGSVPTIKSNYADLYAVMKQRGWIGQFNHPSSSQFAIGGTGMAYDANGAEVMVAAEILNSSAFSTNTSESETGRSVYSSAFNTLLERGYRVFPTTNQDNHCANWGLSFRNRTGVLIDSATPLSRSSFIDALKARRGFAAEDRSAQLVLTANGAVMGQTLSNSGALTLQALYASSNGQSAARVQFFEGVPGRNGTVTQLFEGAGSTTFTPAEGAHFYYALVTETDGDRIWSAPVWINQGAGTGDSLAPTVSASATGSSGSITLAADATDNVGVSRVDFAIDGIARGSDSVAPYAIAFDSTTLANGSHSLTATAFDAAGNSAVSTPVSFNVSNSVADTTPPSVSATASGSSGVIALAATASDNVGVSQVEFYVDGVLRGSDASSPYSLGFDSTSVSDGSHSLTAKAFDAAGNSSTSSAVAFNVSNAVVSTQLTETESNGSIAAANVVGSAIRSIVGTMGNSTDKDYFRIALAAGQTLKVDMVGPTGSSYDYDLYLVNGSDGTLKKSTGSTSTESVTYTNGSSAQTVYAKVIAYKGSSVTQSYTLTLTYSGGTGGSSQLLANPGFESGNTLWTASATDIIDSGSSKPARSGSWKAWLNGYGSANTQSLYQTVSIPSTASSASFSFWLRVDSDETTTTTAWDTLKVQVRNSSNAVLATLATYSNLNKGSSYSQKSFDLSAYKGQSVRIYFEGVEGASVATSFLIDDTSLSVQ